VMNSDPMPTNQPTPTPEVCSYENSSYRADFWEGKGRDYEDAVERVALRALLPPTGQRYIEFGAGFGRLINEAAKYDQVVVMDYSRTLLQDAQSRLGRSERFIYVAADLYRLPFAPNAFDVALMCRVLHHMADVPAVLAQVKASLTPGAAFILEFANKRNLKAMVRYWLKQQTWSPFTREPIEFVKLNFDFHPEYVYDALRRAGFSTTEKLPVSWLRLGLFKRTLPLGLMVNLDRALGQLGKALPVSPSIFTANQVAGERVPVAPMDRLFKCPRCGHAELIRENDTLRCSHDGLRWAIRDGIYDFKDPIEA